MPKEKVQKQTRQIIGKGRRILRYGVNIFVYTLVGIFMLFMVFFGISQTSFFKDWLRDTVVEVVNEQINGKLSIEKIEGTIFTSLLISNTALTDLNEDTVIFARKIELKTSPLKLFFKNIYVRKFELADAKVKLIEDSSGRINLLDIFPASEEPEDTAKSEFTFSIEVADFQLKNVDFSLQRFDKVGSTEYYPAVATEDIRINDLNVSFNAFADLDKYEYRLGIESISFNPNFEFFKLNHLSGTVILTPNVAGINKMHLVTDHSDIELSAGISEIDFLRDFSVEKLANAPVRLSLNSEKISFEEITTYLPEMELFSGSIAADFEASGTLNELNIETLTLSYEDTYLNARSRLKNLLDPDRINIDLSFRDSYLSPAGTRKLFKGLELPDFSGFGIIAFDTLNYSGSLQNFRSVFALSTDRGNINGTAALDFTKADMQYSVRLFTDRVDLNPLISIPTSLNTEFNISGTGTDPKNMKLEADVTAHGSQFGNSYLHDMLIITRAENGIINSKISVFSDSLYVDINSSINFNNPEDPAYELKGVMNQLSLGSLLNDERLASKFNFSVDLTGQGFDPDSLDLFLVTDIEDSYYGNFNIDSTRLILDVRRNDKGRKIINIVSDIADLTLSGNYSVISLGDVFAREAEIINTAIEQKIVPVLYADSVYQGIILSPDKVKFTHSFDLDYLVDFKEQLKIDIGENQIELDGLISGEMNSANDSLNMILSADFQYFKFWNQEDIFFVVNSEMDCELSNHLINGYDGNINAAIKILAERIYAGGNIYNLSADLSVKDDLIKINASADYEDNASAEIGASAAFNGNEVNFKINTFDLLYNRFKVSNRSPLLISYSDQNFSIEDFILYAADGRIILRGDFGAEGDHNLSVVFSDISGNRLAEDMMGISPDKNFNCDIEIEGNLSGSFSDPRFSISADLNDIYYANGSFGSLISTFNYAENSLYTDIKFLDSLKNYAMPQLIVSGYIPLNLSAQKDSAVKSTGLLDLTVQSDEFDLGSLSGVIPYVDFQRGKLETDVYLTGTITKPVAMGYFSIKDTRFKVSKNNLDYDLNTKIWIDDEVISIETVELKNTQGTEYGGALKGNGTITLNNFLMDSSYIRLSGDLKVLDQISRSANPMVYGDLALKTRGDIIYTSHSGKSYLLLPIDVTVAELTVPLGKSAYSKSSDFIYRYYDHSSTKDRFMSELDSLIQLSNEVESDIHKTMKSSKFDYTVDIKLDTEAEITINLSRELDQNLNLILKGDFFIESAAGKSRSGGALYLLEGSKLSFIKSFDARGNVSFEKLDNPIIDITSTYKDYYYPLESQNGSSTEQEVAVKIKLKGPLSELNKNFMSDENNIGVYMGRQAIEEDKKDPSKSASDAMFFIITGKFTDGASQQDRNAVASTATSLAGSLIGGVLNKYFDDYIKGFQLRQTGTETKFNLIGKAGRFKYEIGGSTDVLQDLSRANIKIEYPVTERLQLRIQRKESENQLNSINNPLFNELGIKYNFEF